ncbi:MAG: hypothetical protein AAGB27_16575, partial [Pseudomonadota bacterium]
MAPSRAGIVGENSIGVTPRAACRERRLVVLLAKRMPPARAAAYVPLQLLGSALAALTTRALAVPFTA